LISGISKPDTSPDVTGNESSKSPLVISLGAFWYEITALITSPPTVVAPVALTKKLTVGVSVDFPVHPDTVVNCG